MDQETADVKDAVEHNIGVHCCVAETKEFMNKLLPVPQDSIKKIFEEMKDKGYYSNERWIDFPAEDGSNKEDAVYKAFITVSNAIREAAEAGMENIKRDSPAEYLAANEWLDHHSRMPRPQDNDGPGAFLALATLKELLERMGGDAATKKAMLQLAFWWSQIVAVVEMKRYYNENRKQLVKQLVGCLRRLLCEQLDRRFVFSLTVDPSQMSVLMHDRSGVLVTATAIDIHKNPDLFIRVIAAFVVLPADKLGFDPSMKLYDKSTRIATPSYRLTKPVNFTSPHDTQWVIRLIDGTEYLTVKTLSVHTEIMRGRGTTAWAVVPCHLEPSSGTAHLSGYVKLYMSSNLPKGELQMSVLKQSWRPLADESEARFYESANGSKSDYIGAIRLCKKLRKEDRKPYLFVHCINKFGLFRADHSGEPVSRIRTRVLISTYGWPLERFCTLGELLRVLQDAIKGHKHLYANGVLHRDISPGNIIIEWQPESPISSVSSRGRLIDLDRAKYGNEIERSLSVAQTNHSPHQLETMAAFIAMTIGYTAPAGFTPPEIQHDVIRRGLEIRTQAGAHTISLAPVLSYVPAAFQHALTFGGYHPEDRSLSCKTLHWKKIEQYHDYQSAANEQGSRTGTPPYTSGEILSGLSYFSETTVYHDSIHDLESFFWILVQICLTQKGPGEGRREELTLDVEDVPESDGSPTSIQQLRYVVWCMFAGDLCRLQDNKRHIFLCPEYFETHILDNFHLCFAPLKPLISEWFSLLQLAHRYHGYEYHDIHDRVLAIFDKVLWTAGPWLDDVGAAGKEELETRKNDIERIKDMVSTAARASISPHPSSDRLSTSLGVQDA